MRGIPGRVAFRLTGADGLPVDAAGMLNDSIPLTVAHDGMGIFSYTPTSRNGRAVFSAGGRDYTFKAFDAHKDVEQELDNGEFSGDLAGYLQSKGYAVEFTEDGYIASVNGFPIYTYYMSRKGMSLQITENTICRTL